jgi:AraC-like DNA-binding protein
VDVSAQSLPPVQRHQFKTTDPEHAHEFVRQNYTEHSMRPPVKSEEFVFAHTTTSSQSFSVGWVHYGIVAKVRADSYRGKLHIAQLLSGRFQFDVGRESIRATRAQPVLAPPLRSVQIEWDIPEVGMVTLDAAMVADYAAGVAGIHPAGLVFTGMEPVSALMARHWRSVVRHVAHDVLPNAEAMASPLIRGQTQRLLAASVLATFPNTALEALTDSPAGMVEPAAVRRAIAFIDTHAGEDIGISEISRATRIGPRALQRAFRQYRDTTPMEYLRRVRLNHAHRELLAADPSQGDTVNAIAAQWGFAHAGRFSAVYHAVYGYFPSHTLHR